MKDAALTTVKKKYCFLTFGQKKSWIRLLSADRVHRPLKRVTSGSKQQLIHLNIIRVWYRKLPDSEFLVSDITSCTSWQRHSKHLIKMTFWFHCSHHLIFQDFSFIINKTLKRKKSLHCSETNAGSSISTYCRSRCRGCLFPGLRSACWTDWGSISYSWSSIRARSCPHSSPHSPPYRNLRRGEES